jgi:hypothetical protein
MWSVWPQLMYCNFRIGNCSSSCQDIGRQFYSTEAFMLSSRRRFIQTVVGIPAASVLLPFALAPAARAEVVTAVVAIITVAIQVARLFSAGGPDLASLLRIQTEILNNVSKVLIDIAKDLDRLSRQIAELREYVGTVSGETVERLYQTQLQAATQRHLEVSASYTKALKQRDANTDQLRVRYAGRFQREVAVPIREASRTLMVAAETRPRPYWNVPQLAMALAIEALLKCMRSGSLRRKHHW